MTFVRTQYRLRIPWTPQLRWISLRSADRIAIPKTAFRLLSARGCHKGSRKRNDAGKTARLLGV